jgi:hypothetical protein
MILRAVSMSARWPSQASTACHLPAASLKRPRQSVTYGQCWAWPVPSWAWIMRNQRPDWSEKAW